MNYETCLLLEDRQQNPSKIKNWAVSDSNANMGTALANLATALDPLIDGVIVAGQIKRVISCPLPTGIKASAVAGSRVADKIKIVLKGDSDNNKLRRTITIPARKSDSLQTGSKNATTAFVTAATAFFVSTTVPRHTDIYFNPLTQVVWAGEDYKKGDA